MPIKLNTQTSTILGYILSLSSKLVSMIDGFNVALLEHVDEWVSFNTDEGPIWAKRSIRTWQMPAIRDHPAYWYLYVETRTETEPLPFIRSKNPEAMKQAVDDVIFGTMSWLDVASTLKKNPAYKGLEFITLDADSSQDDIVHIGDNEDEE